MDRNIFDGLVQTLGQLSLSARRAWIEMWIRSWLTTPVLSLSARRAWIEMWMAMAAQRGYESLSARRAWIEIGRFSSSSFAASVALRKESVDRNVQPCINQLQLCGRSPQGERG